MASVSCEPLIKWYDQNRRDLPWRRTHDPYRIWLSEIMLQQTRVETVKGYYARFLEQFPTVMALADAPLERVLKAWEGLGYYSRARNLHRAAQVVAHELDGRFPESYEGLLALPGVGAYTAGAIASIAFSQRVPAIDGNVYRVAARLFGVREDIGQPHVQRDIRTLVTGFLPQERAGDCNQALMELGATVCAPKPDCARCPMADVCDAYREGDAAQLPIHEKKRPPKAVDVAVCLILYQGKVLLVRREQRMLGGMYVFPLFEEETQPERARELLMELGLGCRYLRPLGMARHVFTHRVWEMRLMLFKLQQAPDERALEERYMRFATADELRALPLPTAVRAARKLALELMGE